LVPFDQGTNNYNYSEAYLKMAQMMENGLLKPEDFPGVRNIDDAPIEEF